MKRARATTKNENDETNATTTTRAALTLEAEKLRVEAENARLKAELEDAASDAAKRARSAERAERRVVERDATIRALEQRIRELQAELKASVELKDEYARALDARVGEVDALIRVDSDADAETLRERVDEGLLRAANELVHVKRECETFRAAHRRLEKVIELVDLDVSRVKDNVAAAEKALADKSDETRAHAERIADMKRELTDGVALVARCRERESDREREISALRRALAASRAQTRRLETELDAAAV